MRIWSLHPKYLDTKGLVALWRETLLAKNVLENNTKGYKNHPQLIRFKNADNPLHAINQYLSAVYQESLTRGYIFNKEKFNIFSEPVNLIVTQGQIEYERQHLLKKLKIRDFKKYIELVNNKNIEPHPLFNIIEGEIEEWEIV
ncbi:MAG: pyrimidine dimer DNA glycosylase/endonuclease V [Paludibacter sp.]|nr:pyrimidine dimer DNA glycosylase/endonuclease V [Paludibacter sp.]